MTLVLTEKKKKNKWKSGTTANDCLDPGRERQCLLRFTAEGEHKRKRSIWAMAALVITKRAAQLHQHDARLVRVT